MKKDKDILGPLEEFILMATLSLGEKNAYGTKIRQRVEEAMEKSVSIGALYTTLDRLERKGYVSSRQGESTPERGGRAKRYFRVEGAGVQALNDTRMVRNNLESHLGLNPAGGTI